MAEKNERIDRELVYKGQIVDFYRDTVKIANGNIAKWDFINHKGAAAVLPVTNDGKLLLVKQYRNALDRFTLELPAGGIEPGEKMIDCAVRELEEETGYKCGNIEFLISIKTTVAFCNEAIDIFLATDLTKTQQNLDEDEYIDVECWDIDDLCQLIYDGTIQDSKTVAAVLAYKNKYL